ncbi:MAG: virulence RhuM family protein, partial [Bacteroidia bacterium]|nr:virulence RhuM family protein [Bacteroidia bacterium]
MEKEIAIYQTENGALELVSDSTAETIWASLDQMADLFQRDKSVISRHLKRIFEEKELSREVVVAFFATTTRHGAMAGKQQTKQVAYYNLDAILSVGYRVNSKVAIKFRQWATQILKQHITKGFTINEKVLQKNKQLFLQTLDDLKILIQHNQQLEAKDILSLIQSFSNTFSALNQYDKNEFPTHGTLQEVKASAKGLYK